MARKALEADSTEYISLIGKATKLLASEKEQIGNLGIEGRLVNVKASGEAIVIGDLHGDLESLVYMLKTCRFVEKATKNKEVLLVFLGDYGDRGIYSPEVYYLVLKLKQLFPQKIVLMRGNHEGPDDLLAYPHDLPENLRTRFGEEGSVVYSKIRELFPYLYNAVVVDELCVMVHAGVPSRASSLEDLKFAHLKHPKERHLEEILWSDPDETIKGNRPSARGAGRLFGEDVTRKFLSTLDVKMLIRGHEPAQNGFKISHNGKILTLFSRKGQPYFNASAAYLQLGLSLKPQNVYELVPYIHKF
ncbi:MAG: serine/threonine protein phosphatase [Candidatus Bathyarchaeota archaeon]|nr:serine/threonine protein phosphatase [Candidatus Bathyarchaeota archaeon]